MAAPKEADCDRILVVEGYDDLLFYAELLEHLGAGNGVFINQLGGKGNMTGRAIPDQVALKLETYLSPPFLAAKRAIGVLVDADERGANTATALANRLSRLTAQAVIAGAWTAGQPRIGLFVVPAADGAGELETLVWQAWSNDPANAAPRACIDGYLECMRGAGLTGHSPDKGRLGALLAVRNDEDPRMGPGARKGVFDFERPELAPLLAFLRAF